MPGNAVTVNNGTWEKVADFEADGIDLPRAIQVRSREASTEECEIWVQGATGTPDAPAELDEGYPIQPGELVERVAAVPGGNGRIKAIYLRSDDALIDWDVSIS